MAARWLRVLIACGGLLSGAAAAGTVTGIRAEGARIYASLPGTVTAMLELTLVNEGRHDARLLSVAGVAAARVEIHELRMEAGLMRMRPLPHIDVPRGTRVALSSGGRHLMLVGLRRPLAVGEILSLQLRFAGGGTLSVAAPVVAGQYVR